ncbi:hypothetical protein AAHH87_00395 [Candidatus Hodgkinia cicadicola]
MVASANTQFYVNNSSSVAVLLVGSEASLRVVVASSSVFEARFESCTRLDVELVLSCCASASAVFVSVLSCSNVEVVAKLNTNSRMMALAKALLANQAYANSFNALVLGASSNLKAVYDVLVLQRCVLALAPMFRVCDSRSVCVHSVGVNSSWSEAYFANRLVNAVALAAIGVYV